MAFMNQGARSGAVTALASATSANGTARNGAALATHLLHPGTLVARCVVTIVTGSVVCTVKWQGSLDGSTYSDLVDHNNAAQTTITATATKFIEAPRSASTVPYVRVVMTLSGAATAAGDLTESNYHYLRFGELE